MEARLLPSNGRQLADDTSHLDKSSSDEEAIAQLGVLAEAAVENLEEVAAHLCVARGGKGTRVERWRDGIEGLSAE